MMQEKRLLLQRFLFRNYRCRHSCYHHHHHHHHHYHHQPKQRLLAGSFRRLLLVFVTIIIVVVVIDLPQAAGGSDTFLHQDEETPPPRDEQIQDDDHRHGTTAQSSHPRTITGAVTATTPMLKMQDFHKYSVYSDTSKIPPYVHWVCFQRQRQRHSSDESTTTTTTTVASQKVQCCQTIYQLMQEEPQTLCWVRPYGCNLQRNPHSRTEFLQVCTEQLTTLPLDAVVVLMDPKSDRQYDMTTSSFAPLVPQFSLLLTPPASLPLKRTRIWRQYMWLNRQEDGTTTTTTTRRPVKGQWHYTVDSPLQLAIDPDRFLRPEVDSAAESSSSSSSSSTAFTTTLETKVTGGADEEDRILLHNLTVDFPVQSKSHSTNDWLNTTWEAHFRVLLFVPEGAMFPNRQPTAASPCQTSPSCGTTSRCEVSLVPSSSIQASDVDVQEAFALAITVKGNLLPQTSPEKPRSDELDQESTVSCQLAWTNRIRLDDPEEEVMLGAPVVQDGQLWVDDTVVYQWKRNPTFPHPLITTLDAATTTTTGSEEL